MVIFEKSSSPMVSNNINIAHTLYHLYYKSSGTLNALFRIFSTETSKYVKKFLILVSSPLKTCKEGCIITLKTLFLCLECKEFPNKIKLLMYKKNGYFKLY